jgi:hypothetical protein
VATLQTALTRVYVDKVQATDAAARALASAASAEPVRNFANVNECAGSNGGVRASSDASEDAPCRPSPFVSSITGKVHLVSLPPFLGTADRGRTPCGWIYTDSDHRLLGDIPTGSRCCERCGNPTVWASVHAIISQLDCGYESE